MESAGVNPPGLEETTVQALQKARSLFLRDDNLYGCAETAFLVLKEVYHLPDARDSSAAMAFNGGVAYSGGLCGAISGAALAVGMLAETRCANHLEAKRAARQVTAGLMDEFQAAFPALNCRELTGYNFRDQEEHRRFIESGVWRTNCLAQIEFVIRRMVDLEAVYASWALASAAPSDQDHSTMPGAA